MNSKLSCAKVFYSVAPVGQDEEELLWIDALDKLSERREEETDWRRWEEMEKQSEQVRERESESSL